MDTKTSLNRPRKAVSFPVILAALVVLPASAYFLFQGEADSAAARTKGLEPSALFDDTTACSQPNEALNRARTAEEAGAAKIQRYPFEAQDGVAAVSLYAEAERCYAVAGKPDDAGRARDRLQRWKKHLSQDYRNARLRLRLALQNAQNNDALTEVAAIKAMISHRSDSYTAWLDKLERELTAVEPEKK